MSFRRWYAVLCTVMLILGATSLAYAFLTLERSTEKHLTEIRSLVPGIDPGSTSSTVDGQMCLDEKSVKVETTTPPKRHSEKRIVDDIREVIDFHAKRRGLSEALVKAVIHAESGGNTLAKSRSGACGLMQLMPSTAAEMGIYNLLDPDQNIAGGTRYLAKMFEMFDGNKELALAAYNAGPRAVRRYRGVPPYRETRVYIKRVLRFEKDYASGRDIRLS